MQKKYLYNGETFTSPYAVRQAIAKAENLAFGPEPDDGKVEFWRTLGVAYTEEPDPEPTPEEIEAERLAEAKRLRAAQVAAITVEVDGMVFDGDEVAQARMGRALEVARITSMTSTVWVLADNTVAEVTVAQMERALSAAMLKMAELWTKPYETETATPTGTTTGLGIPTIGI